jgi:hypothetical protein
MCSPGATIKGFENSAMFKWVMSMTPLISDSPKMYVKDKIKSWVLMLKFQTDLWLKHIYQPTSNE